MRCILLLAFLAISQSSLSAEGDRIYSSDKQSHAYSTIIKHFGYVCPRVAYLDVQSHVDQVITYKIRCVKEDGTDFITPLIYRFVFDSLDETVFTEPWTE